MKEGLEMTEMTKCLIPLLDNFFGWNANLIQSGNPIVCKASFSMFWPSF
jgi:hypothetical protein